MGILLQANHDDKKWIKWLVLSYRTYTDIRDEVQKCFKLQLLKNENQSEGWEGKISLSVYK